MLAEPLQLSGRQDLVLVKELHLGGNSFSELARRRLALLLEDSAPHSGRYVALLDMQKDNVLSRNILPRGESAEVLIGIERREQNTVPLESAAATRDDETHRLYELMAPRICTTSGDSPQPLARHSLLDMLITPRILTRHRRESSRGKGK